MWKKKCKKIFLGKFNDRNKKGRELFFFFNLIKFGKLSFGFLFVLSQNMIIVARLYFDHKKYLRCVYGIKGVFFMLIVWIRLVNERGNFHLENFVAIK